MAGTTRIRWIDVAKGIAILSILLHHIPFVREDGSSVLGPYVALYDVCLFYVTAGFFLSTRKPLAQFVLDRTRRLMVPYAVTCLAMGVFILALKFMHGSICPPTIWHSRTEFLLAALFGAGVPFPSLPEGAGYIGAIWFLEAMLVALIEVRILMQITPKHPALGFVSTIVLALCAVTLRRKLYVPFNVEQGLAAAPFLYGGWYYRRLGRLEATVHPALLLPLLIVAAVAGYYGMRPSFVTPSFNGGVLGLIGGLSATLFVIHLSKILDHHTPRIARVLEFYGNNSLIVLCVHLAMLNCGANYLVAKMLGFFWQGVPANVVSAGHIALQLVVSAVVATVLARRRRGKVESRRAEGERSHAQREPRHAKTEPLHADDEPPRAPNAPKHLKANPRHAKPGLG